MAPTRRACSNAAAAATVSVGEAVNTASPFCFNIWDTSMTFVPPSFPLEERVAPIGPRIKALMRERLLAGAGEAGEGADKDDPGGVADDVRLPGDLHVPRARRQAETPEDPVDHRPGHGHPDHGRAQDRADAAVTLDQP